MGRMRVAVGACMLALAACGGEPDAPRREVRSAQTDGAKLNALCKEIVRETGVRMRIPKRQAGEAFPAYGRRVARATAGYADVYKTLFWQLRDLPAARKDLKLHAYLSALAATASQFETASGVAPRNRIEFNSGLFYPNKMRRELVKRAKALDAPGCAPGTM